MHSLKPSKSIIRHIPCLGKQTSYMDEDPHRGWMYPIYYTLLLLAALGRLYSMDVPQVLLWWIFRLGRKESLLVRSPALPTPYPLPSTRPNTPLNTIQTPSLLLLLPTGWY